MMFSQSWLFSIQQETYNQSYSSSCHTHCHLSHCTHSIPSWESLHGGKRHLLYKLWLCGSPQHQCHHTEVTVSQLWYSTHLHVLTSVSSAIGHHETPLQLFLDFFMPLSISLNLAVYSLLSSSMLNSRILLKVPGVFGGSRTLKSGVVSRARPTIYPFYLPSCYSH